MRPRIVAIVATLAMAFGLGALVNPGAAQAALSCYSGGICFYDNSSGSGSSLMYVHDGADHPDCFDLPSGARNRTSYIYNRSSRNMSVYIGGINCAGGAGYIYANSSGPMSSPWSDSIDSFYVY